MTSQAPSRDTKKEEMESPELVQTCSSNIKVAITVCDSRNKNSDWKRLVI